MHLGVWDDYAALDGLVAAARAGGTGPLPDVDAANARVTSGAPRRSSRRRPGSAGTSPRRRPGLPRGRLADARRRADTRPRGRAAAADDDPRRGVRARRARARPARRRRRRPAARPARRRARRARRGHRRAGRGPWRPRRRPPWSLPRAAGGSTRTRTGGGWSTCRRARQQAGAVVRGEAAALLDASAGRANPVGLLARRKLGDLRRCGAARARPAGRRRPEHPRWPAAARRLPHTLGRRRAAHPPPLTSVGTPVVRAAHAGPVGSATEVRVSVGPRVRLGRWHGDGPEWDAFVVSAWPGLRAHGHPAHRRSRRRRCPGRGRAGADPPVACAGTATPTGAAWQERARRALLTLPATPGARLRDRVRRRARGSTRESRRTSPSRCWSATAPSGRGSARCSS